MLDMDRFFYHIDYLHDNPPIGGLFKMYIEAKAGAYKGKGTQQSNNNSNSKDWGTKPNNKRKHTKQEIYNFEKAKMDSLLKDFGMSKAVIKNGKKGGK